jgi:alginate O-acetyltransferase complex protein AlgI
MIFSTPLFLFVFLPIFIIFCFIFKKSLRNLFLIVCSLLFYAWGEPKYVFLLIISIFANYLFSLLIDSSQHHQKRLNSRFWLGLALVVNLAFLGCFKYVGFLSDSWNLFTGILNLHLFSFPVPQWHFPLGISFFTFSAISYVVDIYRREAQFEKNPIYLALYISFFPKLLAGPIVQYRQMKDQMKNRSVSSEKLTYGIKRFVIGLAKKVLVANTLGGVADQIFALSPGQLTMATSWLGCICYTLQIYFDFAGYSDMAIGIAKMAGFDFFENFNYPYISQSIQEFWRRWHISLSNWFRDYLYIPLGGNRRARIRVYFNLMIVFLLCGLWHGAAKTFIVWGAWHGIFITLENAGFSRILKKTWALFRHLYLLFIVMIGWVIFRSDSLHFMVGYLKAMFGLSPGTAPTPALSQYINTQFILILFIAIAFSAPIVPQIYDLKDKLLIIFKKENSVSSIFMGLGWPVFEILLLSSLLVLSIMAISSSLNNPFIYFKF